MVGSVPAVLPVAKEVTEAQVQDVFMQVRREVEELVEEEMRRILDDPDLRRFVVKK